MRLLLPVGIDYFLVRPDPRRFRRRRGFSSRMTAAMFAMSIISFLLSSFNTGINVAEFSVFIRKTIILDNDYPLSEKSELAENALQNWDIAGTWARCLPVSSNLSLLDSVPIHAWWRYYSVILSSFGGLGLSSKIGDG